MKSHAQINLTLTLILSSPIDATGRLKQVIAQVANQPDEKLEKLGYELEDVTRFRSWLDILCKQAYRASPRFGSMFSQLNEAMDGMLITREPVMSSKSRQLMYSQKAEVHSDLSVFAYFVGQSFNSDLFKRVGKCPECTRRQVRKIIQGKPNNPKEGPYFVRGGTGDNRIYCTKRHSNAEMRRRDRAKQKLQKEECGS